MKQNPTTPRFWFCTALLTLFILAWLYSDAFAHFRRGTRSILYGANGGTGAQTTLETPQTVSGLLGWWDASDTDTITGTSEVTAWDDKSGNDNHLTILDANNGPESGLVTQNSLNTIDFDHANTEYLSNNSTSSTADDWTMIWVARINSDTGIPISSRSSLAGTGGSGTRWDWRVAGNNRQLRFAVNSAQVTSSSNADDTSWHIHTVTMTEAGSGDSRTWIDGVIESAGDAIIPNDFADINVGVWHDETLPANATIGEIIVYDSRIDDTDRRTVEAYLQAKWNTAAISYGDGPLTESGGWILKEDGDKILLE